MAVEEIKIEITKTALPENIKAFLKEADKRCDAFLESNMKRRIPRFIPSDSEFFYAALNAVTQKGLPIGNVFCEWGSGFGIGVGLAAMLGYEAYGIEIQETLVEHSNTLLNDFNLDSEILCESYLPEGYSSFDGHGGHDLISGPSNNEAIYYDGMNVSIEEVDLFYVYPWPDEQELMLSLFDAVAGEDAILLAYYGEKDVCVYRKT